LLPGQVPGAKSGVAGKIPTTGHRHRKSQPFHPDEKTKASPSIPDEPKENGNWIKTVPGKGWKELCSRRDWSG
jgi:hypothetical protein